MMTSQTNTAILKKVVASPVTEFDGFGGDDGWGWTADDFGFGVVLNSPDENGLTPLHTAALSGKPEDVRALVDAGADVNQAVQTGCFKLMSPLHIAAQMEYTGVVRALVDAGADVNAVDDDGKTPWHIAAQKEHTDVLIQLLGAMDKDKGMPIILSLPNYETILNSLEEQDYITEDEKTYYSTAATILAIEFREVPADSRDVVVPRSFDYTTTRLTALVEKATLSREEKTILISVQKALTKGMALTLESKSADATDFMAFSVHTMGHVMMCTAEKITGGTNDGEYVLSILNRGVGIDDHHDQNKGLKGKRGLAFQRVLYFETLRDFKVANVKRGEGSKLFTDDFYKTIKGDSYTELSAEQKKLYALPALSGQWVGNCSLQLSAMLCRAATHRQFRLDAAAGAGTDRFRDAEIAYKEIRLAELRMTQEEVTAGIAKMAQHSLADGNPSFDFSALEAGLTRKIENRAIGIEAEKLFAKLDSLDAAAVVKAAVQAANVAAGSSIKDAKARLLSAIASLCKKNDKADLIAKLKPSFTSLSKAENTTVLAEQYIKNSPHGYRSLLDPVLVSDFLSSDPVAELMKGDGFPSKTELLQKINSDEKCQRLGEESYI